MFAISIISMILIIIGALNWGLVGFFNYNFISVIFGGAAAGDYSGFDRFIFAIIGLAGLWGLSFLAKLNLLCCCKKSKGCCPIGKKKDDDNEDV